MNHKQIKFTEGENRMPAIEMRHKSGAFASLYTHGAHLASWKTPDSRDRIFMSNQSLFQPDAPIRGGIPVVFPQFSDNGPLPKHGFARTANWKLAGNGETEQGSLFCSMSTESNSNTRMLWPYDFEMRLDITLDADTLALDAFVRNTGKTHFDFSMAFHTYFSVSDISQTGITGLKGVTFLDSLAKGKRCEEKNDVITFQSETDRIYINAPDKVTFSDSAAGLAITKENMQDIVVWNPWIEKSASLEDFGDDEYTRMVCVETGNISNKVALDSGEEWHGKTFFTPL